jgi:calcium-dependent protein kinase
VKIINQILEAVNYLHEMNIVHRDIKPENILLSNKTNVFSLLKLIDFGTAIEIPKGKKLKKFIGTSYYVAPEVIDGCYDKKCDVWSCGIILYILLAGYPPFNGNTNKEIYHAIKNQKLLFESEYEFASI